MFNTLEISLHSCGHGLIPIMDRAAIGVYIFNRTDAYGRPEGGRKDEINFKRVLTTLNLIPSCRGLASLELLFSTSLGLSSLTCK